MVAEILDKLVADHDGCRVVAYADLATDMVLITNKGHDLRREALDALCREASLTLAAADGGAGQCHTAVTATPDHMKLFLRTGEEAQEALCCICSPTIDMTQFLPALRASLADLAGDSA
jgi:hypothetical protein